MSLVAVAVLWSSGGVLIKLIEWNPLAIAGMRSAITAVLIMIVVRKPKFSFSSVQIGGAICFLGTVLCFVSATKLTTAANAILLQYTAPIYTALFAHRFLVEETSWVDWITIAVVLCGVALFFLDDLTLGGYYGNILALVHMHTHPATAAGPLLPVRAETHQERSAKSDGEWLVIKTRFLLLC